jgi:hypothetical protein
VEPWSSDEPQLSHNGFSMDDGALVSAWSHNPKACRVLICWLSPAWSQESLHLSVYDLRIKSWLQQGTNL